jgi:ATP-dependent DNA helicase DinG
MFESLGRLRGEAPEVRLRAPGAFREPATPTLRALVAALREQHASIEDPSLAIEWKSRTDRLEETLHAISLVHGQLDRDLVYWAEGAGPHTVLRAAPVEVAPILRRVLFPRVRTVVLTSATLRVGGSFEHFERRVGLEEPMERALGSPFDFRRQCRLLLYPHLPDPRDEAHEAAAIERMRGLALESGGGAFLLFTSHRALARAHDALREELLAAGLRVLKQGSGLRHRDIVEAFARERNCVLFATDTFWQGVDVRGENLRLVVVARLPFAVPDHPLQQARVERIEEEGGDAFRQLSLPDAVLKLRQGFGRLIRTHEDEGAVAILDPRIVTKWYGKVFLDSLPECRLERRP